MRIKKILLFLSDIAILYLSLFLTLVIRYGYPGFENNWPAHFLPFSLIFVVWLLLFYLADLYKATTLRNQVTLLRAVVVAVVLGGLISMGAFYLFTGFFELTPKTNLAIFTGIVFVLMYAWRSTVAKFTASNALSVLLIGDSPAVSETADYLEKNPQSGYRIAAHFKALDGKSAHDLVEEVERDSVNLVAVQAKLLKDPEIAKLIYRLLPLKVNAMEFADFYETVFEKVPLEEIAEDWFVKNLEMRRPFYDVVKRAFDIVVAFLSGLICIPFAVISAILVGLTSRGPIIFSQKRFGANGRVFKLYKFRTMRTWKGGEDGTPAWTEKNDPRITPVGRFLRFTHLDEIPQLWNILKNDISFIGPRPEREELAKKYAAFPYYEMRHIVRPGLTGWAQVNYRPSASLEEAYEKLKYDIYYVKNRSFFVDLLVTIKTIRYIFIAHS
ncbi:sugar transferase [Patescibacteria group bacterium]|nr:sugar transferase [Patescibacteria group bacterium]